MHKQAGLKSYLTTDNPQNICKKVTTTTLQNYDAFDKTWWTLPQIFSGYYICKIMVVIAYFLIKADVTLHRCSVVTTDVQDLSYVLDSL